MPVEVKSNPKESTMPERCSICGCLVHRNGEYAQLTIRGRSHATSHHCVAERFFGRSANRRGTQRERLFKECPWNLEGKSAVYCYECHEELLHNPVLTHDDVRHFAELVRLRDLHEDEKSEDRSKLAGRIKLFQEVIERGIERLLQEERQRTD
jgi:hypothetical protein